MPPYRDSHSLVVLCCVCGWVDVREKDSEKVSTYAWWYSYLRDCLSLNSQEMKTASLGLLEVMVVRVNAGGGMPPHFILLEVQSATRLLGPTKGISTGGKWRA